MILRWNPKTTAGSLHELLRTLAEEYPLEEVETNANLVLEKAQDPETLRVTRREETWFVAFGREDLAARGIAYALSKQECAEQIPFKTYGILFDCTRGNVVTVKHFKFWLRRLAMMGYNMAMIYVKDAYQLPDEPYFGYMRGAYSLQEMKEIDAYAKKLKIEMVASLQALGHVEPLRWSVYGPVKDTADILLVDEPKTYELIRKMLTFWSEALSSRRIHLGMDETHNLGRGRFMDLHGCEDPFSIYNRHLNKVCGMCKELKFEPIIWADMYFRYSNINRNYYDTKSKIPEEVKKTIPAMVQLSYWDYYNRDEETYVKMLTRTHELNNSAAFMASGVWTWLRTWTDFEQTFATIRPCIAACRKTGTKELIYTLWGDDGGYCDFNSALAGLAWAADYAFNHEQENDDRTARFYEAVCGTSYTMQLICGNLTYTYRDKDDRPVKLLASQMLWDDPLMGIVWNEIPALKPGLADTLLTGYKNIMKTIEPHRDDAAAGDLNYAWNVANVLVQKIELRQRLLRAYCKRDFNTLETISQRYIPDVLDAIDGLLESFRVQWKRSFKSYGLELMQIRLGGLIERYRELGRVIDELIHGEIDSIPELETEHKAAGELSAKYMDIATGGFFI